MSTNETIQSHGWNEPPRQTLAPGVCFDDYELVERLGRGGMGEIWRARDLAGKRDVAIKFVPPDIQNAGEEMDRVQRMFQQVHGLQHQHICPLYVMKSTPGFGTYIVMKYIPGMTLAKYANKIRRETGDFSLEKLLEILKPVAAALDYAHAQNVVHRDIKPGNIMVVTDDAGEVTDVQLIDFGLAATFRASMSRVSEQKLNTSGTRPYMAPEQWRGAFQDAATDQYALGVTVYELLTGIFPFDSDDVEALRLCVLNDPPEPIPTQPDAVNAATGRALAKERKSRFASCTDFVAALAGTMFVEVPDETPFGAKVSEYQQKIRKTRATEEYWGPIWTEPGRSKIAEHLKQRVVKAVESLSDHRKAFLADTQRMDKIRAGAWRVVKFCLWTVLALVILSVPFFYIGMQVESDKIRKKWEDTPTAHTGGTAGDKHEYRYNGVLYAWQWCPPGEFTMGTVNRPLHVKITDGFWILDCEVTQEMWQQIMNRYNYGNNNPSYFKSQQNPVEQVSWEQAQEFCRAMSLRFGKRVTLPTEAQWEYACRAGNSEEAADTDAVAWYEENSGSKTHPVRAKEPNAWGIYDMQGNVAEWCYDRYGDLPGGDVIDPIGTSNGPNRVVRGGSAFSSAEDVTASARTGEPPGGRDKKIGFRVIMSTGANAPERPGDEVKSKSKRSYLKRLIFGDS